MWFEVRTRRQLLALAVSAGCCFSFGSGCGDGVDDDNLAVAGGFAPADRRIALFGAAEIDDDGARLRWSSAGITFRFVGRARVLIDDAIATDDLPFEDGGNRLLLTLDDNDARRRVHQRVEQVRGDVVIEAATPTTVRLVKQSEAFYGAVRIVAVVVDEGRLLPPPALPTKTLLVLGDSFATGFGIAGDVAGPDGERGGPSCKPAPDNMDITRAWPLLIADTVERDIAVVAWSGRGVVRDYAGDEGPLTVPELWSTTTLARAPDDVVIALGGNDHADGAPDPGRFRARWQQLLDDDLPARRFVLPPDVDSAPPQRPLDADDFDGAGVLFVDGVPPLRTGEGCLWHPGTRAHADHARALAPRLQKLLQGNTPR